MKLPEAFTRYRNRPKKYMYERNQEKPFEVQQAYYLSYNIEDF
jgi:hypothetical protein